MKRIIIKQYEQAADEKVSIGGIKWLKKWDVCVQCDSREEAEALKARLALPEKEQEPVAWFMEGEFMDGTPSFIQVCETDPEFYTPLYRAAPPQRKWQGLTEGEIIDTAKCYALGLAFPYSKTTTPELFARAIEAKLKEKNA